MRIAPLESFVRFTRVDFRSSNGAIGLQGKKWYAMKNDRSGHHDASTREFGGAYPQRNRPIIGSVSKTKCRLARQSPGVTELHPSARDEIALP